MHNLWIDLRFHFFRSATSASCIVERMFVVCVYIICVILNDYIDNFMCGESGDIFSFNRRQMIKCWGKLLFAPSIVTFFFSFLFLCIGDTVI